jgi:Na+-translocating ferredoxin:NAD+ oxidoreductase RnfD subunit
VTASWFVPEHERRRRQRELVIRSVIVSVLLAATLVCYFTGWTAATIVCAVLTILASVCLFLTEPTLDQHDH